MHGELPDKERRDLDFWNSTLVSIEHPKNHHFAISPARRMLGVSRLPGLRSHPAEQHDTAHGILVGAYPEVTFTECPHRLGTEQLHRLGKHLQPAFVLICINRFSYFRVSRRKWTRIRCSLAAITTLRKPTLPVFNSSQYKITKSINYTK